MNKRIFTIVTALFLVIFSCKEKKESKKEDVGSSQEITKEKDRPFFSFKLDAEIKSDDKIVFYYLTPETQQISKKQSLEKEVLGSNGNQSINFNLPEEILPTRILVKFGEDGDQVLKINKVSLSYGNNKIDVPDSLFYQFFTHNKAALYNKENNSIKAIKNEKQKPMFFSRKALENKIDLNFF